MYWTYLIEDTDKLTEDSVVQRGRNIKILFREKLISLKHPNVKKYIAYQM